MNVQNIDAALKAIESYTDLDTQSFREASEHFLKLRKRKTYDLRTQQVLKTLIELHADVTSITAFMLFQLKPSERSELNMSKNILALVKNLDGLKDVVALQNLAIEQSNEAVRKMLLAMSKDLRVVLILMAYRYAELLQLDVLSPELRRQIARQTLEIFVPIAGRLGIYTLKRKLEDYCFSYLSHTDYKAIESVFQNREELQDKTIKKLTKQLQQFLQAHGVKATVSGRVKGKYSTYTKLKRKGGGSIDEIHDLLAMRIIVEKQPDCYHVLSLVNNEWQAIAGRFKDYIAMPKVNGYRSLHNTVLGMLENSLQPVEIQIRTVEMHREAEYGIAAHWWYEEEGGKKTKRSKEFVGHKKYEEKLNWVKNLVQLQDSMQGDVDSQEVFEFFADRIFVMTLNGMVIELPKGSTPLDFAYAISDSLGNHCSKARVNGEVVPLDYELSNGDRVFVVKNVDTSPNLYWLSIVKTEKARQGIRRWLLEQGEDTVLDQGLRMVNHRLRQLNHPLLDPEYSLIKSFRGKELTLQNRKQLLIDIGQGKVAVDDVVRATVSDEQLQQRRVAFAPLNKKEKNKIYVAGESGFSTKIAACCSPSDQDNIIGYVTRGGFISVHLQECKVLQSLDSDRCIEAWWSGKKPLLHKVSLEVIVNVSNLLIQLSQILRLKNISLISFSHRPDESGYALDFDIEVSSQRDVELVIKSWEAVKGVLEVKVL